MMLPALIIYFSVEIERICLGFKSAHYILDVDGLYIFIRYGYGCWYRFRHMRIFMLTRKGSDVQCQIRKVEMIMHFYEILK